MAVLEASQKSKKRVLEVYPDKVSCKSGCTSCCSRMLTISIAEALILYDYLVETKKWPEVKSRAEAQFVLAQEVNPLSWFKMNIKCPILDLASSQCLAYPVRPPKCSSHLVTSPPEGCDPWSLKQVRYEKIETDDILEEFKKELENGVPAHGILLMTVPIPVAVLVAEKITVQSSLTVEEAVSLLYHQFK